MTDLPFTGTTQRQRMPHAEIPGCALVQDLIPLYLDGEVTPESHVLIADHLQRCERCSGYLAGARTLRSQILHEQQAIRATTTTHPTVTQVREPVANSLGMALWQSLMVLLYGAGLLLGLVTVSDSGSSFGPMAALVLVISGLAGLLAVGSARTKSWLALMLITGASGAIFALLVLGNGGYNASALTAYAMGVAILGAWGVWLHYTQQSATVTRTSYLSGQGAHQAIFTALQSIVAAIMCSVVAIVSLLYVAQGITSGYQQQILVAGLLLAGSIGGILLIIRQRGWLAGMAKHLQNQLLGWVFVIVGGVLLLATPRAGGLLGAPLLLPLAGIGAAYLGLRMIGKSNGTTRL